jgi:hypothetical protein
LLPFAALAVAAELADSRVCPDSCRPLLGVVVGDAGPYCRALCDNGSHAVLAALVWHAAVPAWPPVWACSESRVFIAVRAGALLCGSLLDVDHFLRARSLALADATSPAPDRPPGHALVAIPLVAVLVAGCITFVLGLELSQRRYWRTVALVTCALLSHQLRDGTRRGLWLWPVAMSTAPLARNTYRAALVALPLAARGTLAVTGARDPRGPRRSSSPREAPIEGVLQSKKLLHVSSNV